MAAAAPPVPPPMPMAPPLASPVGPVAMPPAGPEHGEVITSWAEYSDVPRKTERYTRAIIELENVLSEWNAMSEVEKASTSSISHLVHSAESLISDERVAWLSTANKDSKDPAAAFPAVLCRA